MSEWWSIFSDQYNATASMVKPPIEARVAGPSSSRKGKKPAKSLKSVPPVARYGLVQQRCHRFPSPAEFNMMMGQPENPAMPSMMHEQEQSGVQMNLSNASAFRPGSSDQQEFQKPQQQEPIADLRPSVCQGKEVDGDSNAFAVRKPVLPSAESDAGAGLGFDERRGQLGSNGIALNC